MHTIYMINEIIDKYRWIDLPETAHELEISLAKTKFEPIKGAFDPIKIEWIPETINREVCDFPNFKSQFTCMSKKAIKYLSSLIGESGEFIELEGIDREYKAFHCLTVYNALDVDIVEEMRKSDKYFSLASPKIVLPLCLEKIGNAHIFHIPEVKNKFFVSQAFKNIYDRNILTGLIFNEVPTRIKGEVDLKMTPFTS
jgi:hypothetical protein